MPQVQKLPTGEHHLMYEICGQPGQYCCEAFDGTGADGVGWDDPAWSGNRSVTGSVRPVFVAENGRSEGWYEAPAPVPGAQDDLCPNFHLAGVASLDGKSLIGFASDYAPDGRCFTNWATGSLPPFPG